MDSTSIPVNDSSCHIFKDHFTVIIGCKSFIILDFKEHFTRLFPSGRSYPTMPDILPIERLS